MKKPGTFNVQETKIFANFAKKYGLQPGGQ